MQARTPRGSWRRFLSGSTHSRLQPAPPSPRARAGFATEAASPPPSRCRGKSANPRAGGDPCPAVGTEGLIMPVANAARCAMRRCRPLGARTRKRRWGLACVRGRPPRQRPVCATHRGVWCPVDGRHRVLRLRHTTRAPAQRYAPRALRTLLRSDPRSRKLAGSANVQLRPQPCYG